MNRTEDWPCYVWEGWFSLTAPSTWCQTQDDEVISLYDARSGVGALQVSLARRSRNGPASHAEAEELALTFAASRGWDIKRFRRLQISGSPACNFKCIQDDEPPTFWEVWSIVDDNRAVTITYVCDAEQEDAERCIREEIIGSFSWLPTADDDCECDQ